MNTHHSSKYRFIEPESIREANDRLKSLLLDIRNIEKQLGDHVRTNRDGDELTPEEYIVWNSKTRASLVYKQYEQQELKHWIRERRRQIDASKVDIDDPNDARQLLMAARTVLRSVLRGEEPDHLGQVATVIEQYLIHAS